MTAAHEISGEVVATTTTIDYLVAPETDVYDVKADENEKINIANFDDDFFVTKFEAPKGPNLSRSTLSMQHIVHMFPSLKLNPMAEEFVPYSHSHVDHNKNQHEPTLNYLAPPYYQKNSLGNQIEGGRSWRNLYSQDRRRLFTARSWSVRSEDKYRIRKTLYVTEIGHNVTEERLADLFSIHGQVLDCRICGDPFSLLRFAFIEFANEDSARAALSLSGTNVGLSRIRVMPSKTAIVPINPTLLPQSEDERERCARTICCTNIDKQVTHAEVKSFFETRCGQISRMRILEDEHHSTRIAFIEFVMADSAVRGLDCCGELLGRQQIRVNTSKTPVRARGDRFFPTN